MKSNMSNEVTSVLQYKKVKVFGLAGWISEPTKTTPLFGPIPAGLKVAKIAADHAGKGFDVLYEEYRDPNDTGIDANNIYADCTIRNPTSEVA